MKKLLVTGLFAFLAVSVFACSGGDQGPVETDVSSSAETGTTHQVLDGWILTCQVHGTCGSQEFAAELESRGYSSVAPTVGEKFSFSTASGVICQTVYCATNCNDD